MNIEFTENGWEDFQFWILEKKSIASKIIKLLKSIQRTPTSGIGKPEPLKHEFKGCWSRRINSEHRLVYRITGNENPKCIVLQCKYHYKK